MINSHNHYICSCLINAVSRLGISQMPYRHVGVLQTRALSSDIHHVLCSYSRCASLPSPFKRNSHTISFSRRPSNTLLYSAAPRSFTTQSKPMSDRPFEEEGLPSYDPEEFYPVRLGNTINSRYHVIGKLGYGANSTVWFCRDLRDDEYVVVKIYVRTPFGRTSREKAIYEHLKNLNIRHPEHRNVRQALDIFEIEGSHGVVHVCLVHRPLQSTLYAFQRLGGARRALPEELVKMVMRSLLEALDFLHREANVTHCDLKLSNIMLRVEDKSILAEYEEAEIRKPSDRKFINGERTIYASRAFRHPRENAYGLPVLCDLGEARVGVPQAYAEIQPDIYKAPEILMQFGWGHSADIWNAACVLWELLEAERLFDGSDREGLHNNRYHINEMVGLLGEPPKTFLRRSPHARRLFDERGKWNAEPPVVPLSLEKRARHLKVESKAKIIDFLQAMLRWLPEDRQSARELLHHPWLSEGSD